VAAQVGGWSQFFASKGRGLTAASIVLLVVALLAVGFVSIWSLRRTVPLWVTLVVAANVLLFLVFCFSVFYWSDGTAKNWYVPHNDGLTHLDAVYIALGTLTTGTGVIHATSQSAQRLLTFQLGIDLVVFTIIAGLVVQRAPRVLGARPASPVHLSGDALTRTRV
jgi:hypothetical protein